MNLHMNRINLGGEFPSVSLPLCFFFGHTFDPFVFFGITQPKNEKFSGLELSNSGGELEKQCFFFSSKTPGLSQRVQYLWGELSFAFADSNSGAFGMSSVEETLELAI
eukprot:GHVP01029212.1.p1 GENE.GHVP01029212.1~~GHVP01029212.1.p1  ORF type:complete len:108 (+),score=20.92 GHVP01029212.1:372-695(+)